MKKIVGAFLTGVLVTMAFSFIQSKKDLRLSKIESETTFITARDAAGKEITFKDSYTLYNRNGNPTEETEFFRDGTIKKKHTNKYNSFYDKIEEIEFDGKDGKTTKTVFTYNANGQKTAETQYNADNMVMKSIEYTYDSKGFKTIKKTLDGQKAIISIKKYQYTSFK